MSARILSARIRSARARPWWILLAASACSLPQYHRCDKADSVSLTIRGEGWTGIGDDIIHMRVVETKDGWIEQSEQIPLEASGSLNQVFRCGLDDGARYTVAWYIETNGTTGCQSRDAVWSVSLGTVGTDELVEVDPDDPQDAAACDYFN